MEGQIDFGAGRFVCPYNATQEELQKAWRTGAADRRAGVNRCKELYPLLSKENEGFSKFHSYLRGWSGGVTRRVKDTALAEHADPVLRECYLLGYTEGTEVYRNMITRKMQEYGYTPNFLRTEKE